MGESFCDAEIEEAVAFGSFDNLRALESKGFFRQGGLTLRNPKDPESFKVRRAKVGGYRDYFTAEQVGRARGAGAPSACRRPSATVPAPRRRAAPERMRAGRGASADAGAALERAAELDGAAPRRRRGSGWCSATSRATTPRSRSIAPALGWPCERKHVRMAAALRAPASRGSSPRSITSTARRSDPLEPPWPDLVLTIGRRPSDGGACGSTSSPADGRRLVLFGKPSGMMERFDLVVAGAEVQLPPLRQRAADHGCR